MATRAIKQTGLLLRKKDGAQPKVLTFKEANSQSFVTGDLVYLASGAVTVCGADPATILGIALADATNVTSGNIDIPVLICDSDQEFSMSVYDSTAAQATFSDMTSIGSVAYGIAQNAAGKWVLDHDEVSSTRVVITDYPVQTEALGDLYMQVMVKVLAANQQVI